MTDKIRAARAAHDDATAVLLLFGPDPQSHPHLHPRAMFAKPQPIADATPRSARPPRIAAPPPVSVATASSSGTCAPPADPCSELTAYLAQRLGGDLSVPEITFAVDELLEDERYFDLVQAIATLGSGDHSGGAPTFASWPNPVASGALIVEADRLVAERDKAMAAIAAARAQAGIGPPPPRPRLWYLVKPAFPTEFRKGLLAGERAYVCELGTWALLGAGFGSASTLLELLVASLRCNLAFLAGLPMVEVSEDVLPRSERLDWAKVEAEHTAREAGYQRGLATARARDLGGYPSCESDDD